MHAKRMNTRRMSLEWLETRKLYAGDLATPIDSDRFDESPTAILSESSSEEFAEEMSEDEEGGEALDESSPGEADEEFAEERPGSQLLFHNHDSPFDVNADSQVTAFDALLIINDLSRHGARQLLTDGVEPQSYFDTNADNSITAIDALVVINELGKRSSDPPSGESIVRSSPPDRPSLIVKDDEYRSVVDEFFRSMSVN